MSIASIFVPIRGNSGDTNLFATALAVARPLAAHLEFFHPRFSPCVAAVRRRHDEFCVGAEINIGLENLRQQDEASSVSANKQFLDFCEKNAATVGSEPKRTLAIGAELLEETDAAEVRLLFHARRSDLVVINRPPYDDLLPVGLIEILLLGSRRPIIIAPAAPPVDVTQTIIIGWKDSLTAVRSIATAYPLLRLARRIIVVHLGNVGQRILPDGLNELRLSLAQTGISIETQCLATKANPATQLQQVAAKEGATLLVVGGYSHRPLREAVFGGMTRALIEHANMPVFMMH